MNISNELITSAKHFISTAKSDVSTGFNHWPVDLQLAVHSAVYDCFKEMSPPKWKEYPFEISYENIELLAGTNCIAEASAKLGNLFDEFRNNFYELSQTIQKSFSIGVKLKSILNKLNQQAESLDGDSIAKIRGIQKVLDNLVIKKASPKIDKLINNSATLVNKIIKIADDPTYVSSIEKCSGPFKNPKLTDSKIEAINDLYFCLYPKYLEVESFLSLG